MGSGCLHIYTGNGKGKTTAALGLLCRAIGAGYKTALVQFDKGNDSGKEFYSERTLFKKIKNIDIFPYGCSRINSDGTFRKNITQDDIGQALKALTTVEQIIQMQSYNVVVLDEIITSAHIGLITQDDLMKIVTLYKKNRYFELVMTGINASEQLIRTADLVTEMRNIKHYFKDGRKALRGIEF